ncbi:hypothetical protein C8J56DRAFT_1058988 [Mycena floridula]|nr:hypothetical protein C8J56DRAFT_1058988 [Mycena floridula]
MSNKKHSLVETDQEDGESLTPRQLRDRRTYQETKAASSAIPMGVFRFPPSILVPPRFVDQTSGLQTAVEAWWLKSGLSLDQYSSSAAEAQIIVASTLDKARRTLATTQLSSYIELKITIENLKNAVSEGTHLETQFNSISQGSKSFPFIRHLAQGQAHLHGSIQLLSMLSFIIETAIQYLYNAPTTPELIKLLRNLISDMHPRPHPSLNAQDLKSLLPKMWLTIGVIDFFTTYLSGLFSSDYHCVSAQFAFRFISGDKIHKPDEAMRYFKSRNMDLIKVKKILIPVNAHQNHWLLCVVDMESTCVTVFDSWEPTFVRDQGKAAKETTHAALVSSVVQLMDLLLQKHLLPPVEWLQIPRPEDIPFQQNGHDCGIYTVLYMWHLLHGDAVNGKAVPAHLWIPPNSLELTGFRFMMAEIVQSTSPTFL